MIELSRGLSFVLYTYEGGPLRFHVPFPFILREHVRVLVGDPDAARTVVPKWIDSHTVEIPSQSEFLDAPFTVTVRRNTPTAVPIVNFQDGAMLPAKQLNTAVKQLLYAHQEFSEYFGGNTPPIGGGAPGGGTGADIDAIIAALLQSTNMQQLLEAIPRIDSNSETMLEELLRSHGFHDENRLSRYRLTGAETRLITIESDAANIAAQYTELFARMVTAEGEIEANYQQLNTAIATETEARAAAVTGLQASLGDTIAQVEQRFEALVTGSPDPDGSPMWSANWNIRLAATPVGGQPVIAGIGLGIDSETGSSFIVMANKFAIVHPTYTSGGTLAGLKYPFVVGNIGGVATVGVNGSLVVDGTITADKISVTSLAAITANMGTVNGGTFKTHTLDAFGDVIDALEFRAEISNSGTWPVWVGTGVKNENNAVFWVDLLGAAGFKGKVSAPNIVGEFQKAVAVNWTGAITLSYINYGNSWFAKPDFTEVASFTLAAPAMVGETHTPTFVLTVTYSENTSGAVIILEELRTSVWVEVARSQAPLSASFQVTGVGGGGEPYHSLVSIPSFSSSANLIGVGITGGALREFRVRAKYTDIQSPDFANPGPIARLTPVNVTAISGLIYGIR